jgi:hypothetical protein
MTCFSEVFRCSGGDESPNVPGMVVPIGGWNNPFMDGYCVAVPPPSMDESGQAQAAIGLSLAR